MIFKIISKLIKQSFTLTEYAFLKLTPFLAILSTVQGDIRLRLNDQTGAIDTIYKPPLEEWLNMNKLLPYIQEQNAILELPECDPYHHPDIIWRLRGPSSEQSRKAEERIVPQLLKQKQCDSNCISDFVNVVHEKMEKTAWAFFHCKRIQSQSNKDEAPVVDPCPSFRTAS